MSKDYESKRFVCLWDERTKKLWYLNPNFVLSFRQENWGETAAKSAVEVKGQQGYGNHTIYVQQTVQDLAERFDKAAAAWMSNDEAT